VSVQDYGLSKRRRVIIATLFSQLTGTAVVWANEPDPQFDPMSKAMITLRIRNIETKDCWEKLTSNSSTLTNTSTQLGNQSVADIEVKIESFDPYQYADQIYQSLVTRLYRDRFRAILHQANCAVGDHGNLQEVPTTYDNRVISAAVGSIRLAFADSDPLTDQLDSWIEFINGSATPSIPGTFS
jgi:hypothetical protein